MKLGSFNSVSSLILRRRRLVDQKSAKIRVMVNGQYLGDEWAALVAPVVHTELQNQIDCIDNELLDLGVSLD